MAWFLLHFSLIAAISCRETLLLVAHNLTILSSSFSSIAQNVDSVASTVLGQNLASSNPVRRTLLTYLHVTGIERGYGYFAPNVPGSYKLIFELHYPDGTVEYAIPEVGSAAGELRLTGLLDEIGRTRHDKLREYLVKMLARATWREHPNATTIRAVFGSLRLPTIDEFEQGAKQSYDFLYAYDFSVRHESSESETR